MKPENHISCSQECMKVWGIEPSHSQMSSHFGRWSLNGLPNFQSIIAKVKTHWIKEFQKCSNYALTNLLFGLCRFVWIINMFFIRPNPHLGALTHLSTSKMLRTRERTAIHYPSVVFTFGFTVETVKEFMVCQFEFDYLMFSIPLLFVWISYTCIYFLN